MPLEDALELCTGSDTSESDSSDDDLEYSGMINALELANRVREQDFLIDMLKAQLACAKRRADDVEVRSEPRKQKGARLLWSRRSRLCSAGMCAAGTR